jgi:hypothetical protein
MALEEVGSGWLTLVEDAESDYICTHCAGYINLSLIFPASCNVWPWVMASLALSLPARSTMSDTFRSRLDGQFQDKVSHVYLNL